MTPEELDFLLRRLKLSQLGAGRLIDVDGRTIRRWLSGERKIPAPIALLWRIIDRWKLTPAQLDKLKAEDSEPAKDETEQ
jgi:DNA-binding transcriptional regulator YiaG